MRIGIQCIDTTELFEYVSSSTGGVEYFKLRYLEKYLMKHCTTWYQYLLNNKIHQKGFGGEMFH